MSTSRRFSTFDPPSRIPSTRAQAQKGRSSLDDPVQQKLIQVRMRARSHSMSAPSIEAEKEQKKKTLQRLTTLTTSAKAKQVNKIDDQRRQRKTDSDLGKPTRHPTSNASSQTRQPAHTNLKKPMQRRGTVKDGTLVSSVSSKGPRERENNSKASRTATTKKRSTIIGSGDDSRVQSSTPPMINFFESDSDEDEIFERNRSSIRAQRRQSMPAVRDASKNTYSDEQAEGQDDAAFLKELLEIKSRLSKLEVTKPVAPAIDIPPKDQGDNISPRSSVNSPTVSIFDRSSAHSHGGSPADYSSASSVYTSRTRTTCHQRQLRDAFTVLDHQLTLAHKGDPALRRALETVMTTTIEMNQTLWAAIPQELQTDAPTLVAMQRSSDTQLKKLTESLRLLTDTALTRPSFSDERHLSHAHTNAFTPSLDTYGSNRAMPMTRRYELDADKSVYQHVPPYTRSSMADSPSPHSRPNDQVPPLKVAGILDPSQQRYSLRQRRHYDTGFPDMETGSHTRLSSGDPLRESTGSVHDRASVRRQSSLLSRPTPEYHRDNSVSGYHAPSTSDMARGSVYSEDTSTSSSSRLKRQSISRIDQLMSRYTVQTQ